MGIQIKTQMKYLKTKAQLFAILAHTLAAQDHVTTTDRQVAHFIDYYGNPKIVFD